MIWPNDVSVTSFRKGHRELLKAHGPQESPLKCMISRGVLNHLGRQRAHHPTNWARAIMCDNGLMATIRVSDERPAWPKHSEMGLVTIGPFGIVSILFVFSILKPLLPFFFLI